jgi:hypothetical protein
VKIQDLVVYLTPGAYGGIDHGARYAVGPAHAFSSPVTALGYGISEVFADSGEMPDLAVPGVSEPMSREQRHRHST